MSCQELSDFWRWSVVSSRTQEERLINILFCLVSLSEAVAECFYCSKIWISLVFKGSLYSILIIEVDFSFILTCTISLLWQSLSFAGFALVWTRRLVCRSWFYWLSSSCIVIVKLRLSIMSTCDIISRPRPVSTVWNWIWSLCIDLAHDEDEIVSLFCLSFFFVVDIFLFLFSTSFFLSVHPPPFFFSTFHFVHQIPSICPFFHPPGVTCHPRMFSWYEFDNFCNVLAVKIKKCLLSFLPFFPPSFLPSLLPSSLHSFIHWQSPLFKACFHGYIVVELRHFFKLCLTLCCEDLSVFQSVSVFHSFFFFHSPTLPLTFLPFISSCDGFNNRRYGSSIKKKINTVEF